MNRRDNWIKAKLGDYISEYNHRNKSGSFSVYSVTNDLGFCQNYFDKEVASADKSNYKIVPFGCFAYNPSRINVGSVALQDKEDNVIVSPLYTVFQVSPELNTRFLLYYIKSDYASTFIKAYSRGAVRNNLKFKTLCNFEINLPPLDEQHKIVADLDEISETISELQQQVIDLDALVQSTFYTMFGDPIANEKGWVVKKLSEISKIGTGATPSRTNKRYYNGDIPWVKTTEVQFCDIYDTEEKITSLAIKETNCTIYPSGTILMAMYGQGKTRGQLARLKIDASTNQACAAIELFDEYCNKDYIYGILKLLYNFIRNMARGGNQANLNLSLVKSIPIILPPLALQRKFAAKVKAIDEAKAELNAQISEMQTLLASRMDYYFD